MKFREIGRWLMLATVPVTMAVAFATTASASPAVQTQPQKVCAAFAAWNLHRTTANADAMIADTFGGSWTAKPASFILGDIAGVYGDWRSGAAAKYVTSDVRYATEDCLEVAP